MATYLPNLISFSGFILLTYPYYIVNVPKTWDDAGLFCQTQCNSHLASVHSIHDFYQISNRFYEWSLLAAWIGLRYDFDAGTYKWTDHTLFDFGNALNHQLPWAVNEPSHDGHCIEVRISNHNNGTWNDNQCNKTKAFICNECVYNTVVNVASYYVSPNQFEFTNARTYCHDRCHSELASIHNDNDQQMAMYLAHVSPKLHAFTYSHNIQFGLHKDAAESTFSYLDGTPFDYGNIPSPQGIYPWNEGAPAIATTARCVHLQDDMYTTPKYRWAERSNWCSDTSHMFMCNSCDGELNKYAVIHTVKRTYSAAQSYCNTSLGTSLISIHSKYDYDLATQLCRIANSESHDTGEYSGCYVDFARDIQDASMWVTACKFERVDCDVPRYFLCSLPSLLCSDLDWYSLIGIHAIDNCEMYTNPEETHNVIILTKQFINHNGWLIIEHIFKFVAIHTASKNLDISAGIVLFNVVNSNSDYHYLSLNPMQNTVNVLLHMNGMDHVIETHNLTRYNVQLQMNTYYVLKLSMYYSNDTQTMIIVHINDSTQLSFVLNTIQSTIRSGYIGIRNTYTNIRSTSLYISGVSITWNDPLPSLYTTSSATIGRVPMTPRALTTDSVSTASPTADNIFIEAYDTTAAQVEVKNDKNDKDDSIINMQDTSIRYVLYGGGCLLAFFVCCLCLWLLSVLIMRQKRNHKSSAILVPDCDAMEQPSKDVQEEGQTVLLWLTYQVELPYYYPLFIQHGYYSLDLVQSITQDVLEEMGINIIEHQTHIMGAVFKLQEDIQLQEEPKEEVELCVVYKDVEQHEDSRVMAPEPMHHASILDVDDDGLSLMANCDVSTEIVRSSSKKAYRFR
eukprot:670692_1